MKKVLIENLTGVDLDFALAEAMGYTKRHNYHIHPTLNIPGFLIEGGEYEPGAPKTFFDPFTYEELLPVDYINYVTSIEGPEEHTWRAITKKGPIFNGATRAEASARAYVFLKLGAEVNVPTFED
jgi:hypothetical protein